MKVWQIAVRLLWLTATGGARWDVYVWLDHDDDAIQGQMSR